jgi:hypothetical protein
MHARPEIRQVLIIKKLKRWLLIVQHPSVDRTCPPSLARRNYWRLLAKYPEIGALLELNIGSVYLP